MATVNLGRIKPIFKGAYAGGTAYVVDDIVTSGNETFICIQASTGNATSNASYWTKLAAKGTDGTDVGTTITTQGDILYRDASGLARLPAGTSGQLLKSGGSGANPSWHTQQGGGVLQTVFFQTSTRFTSTSDSYVATPLTITITPTSASSKIVLFLRTLINTTGDTYPRFKYQRAISGGATSYINTEPAGANGGASQGVYLTDRANSSNNHQMNVMSDVYQDSPNTTSAITYTLYGVRENGGTYYLNTSANNEGGGSADYDQVGVSNILAMETGV